MKERPILFSAPMVKAILDGTKTQTRRIVKWNNHAQVNLAFSGLSADRITEGHFGLYSRDGESRWQERANARCPYGKPGDRLWVKETFKTGSDVSVFYRADGHIDVKGWPWKPSIFMPRWASRITLEITDVRVQRLQEISEDDAVAEGIVRPESISAKDADVYEGAEKIYFDALNQPRRQYARLWDEINGAGSWKQNPWVWAISFKVI